MTAPDPLALVLTVEEAAEVLRIGRSAAYQAVRAGEIPSLRLGRKIRVPRAALMALLDPSPLRPENEGAAPTGDPVSPDRWNRSTTSTTP